VKTASLHHGFSSWRASALLVLSLALTGCGTDIISYNREFRTQAIAQYNKQDYVGAAQTFKAALRNEPGDYTSRYYLGQCYSFMGHPQQAIEEYHTTLSVMTNSLEGRTDVEMRRKVLASLASAIAKESDRTGDLARIERQQPRTAENAVLLARIYRESGDADLALTRYSEAQQIDPKDPLIAKEYGLYLEQLGQTKKADAELRHAYAMNTHDEEVAAALRRMGVVPGPSLKDEDGLEKPLVPLGPLPPLDLTTSNKSTPAGQPSPGQQGPGAVGSSTSPRD
jgi:Tfp pilus assembly protein PilF